MIKSNLYIISLNLVKDKHKDLIEWIKKEAQEEERSISAFCINILKEYKKQKEKMNDQNMQTL